MSVQPRFHALDELRALAIFSMCLAHFAPGLVGEVAALRPLGDAIGVIGRLSTVAFVVVFGLVLGFVQFPKALGGQHEEVSRWFLGRAKVVGACALLTSLPTYMKLAAAGQTDPMAWLFGSYSVLNFYVFAMLSAPLWLWVLRRDTFRRAAWLSVVHWLAGFWLLQVWAQDTTGTPLEFVRMHLVSGGYAYFPLAAATLLAIPVGLWMREQLTAGHGQRVALTLLSAGCIIALAGYVLGLASGEMTVGAIASGAVKGPARLWYWALFGGSTLILLGLIAFAHQGIGGLHRLTWPAGLFGQAALGIYTTHAWVLPILDSLDQVALTEGMLRAGLAFSIFATFVGLAMLYYVRKNGRRTGRNASAVRVPLQLATA